MKHDWIPVSRDREMEWMHLASGMLQGTIFEYYPEQDYMVYTKYEEGGYRFEKRIDQYFSIFKNLVHPEDIGDFHRLMEQIRLKKPRIYAELRVCFDLRYPNYYLMGAIQGITQFDEKGEVNRVVGQMFRMQEQWKEKQKLYNEAKRDSMTLLWNHKYTKEFIRDYLNNEGVKGALFIIDVDNFKKINDTLGHLFGDQVILAVSRVLKNTFRNTDIIGRIGGDEFVVFMKNEVSREIISQKCNELCSAVSKVYCGEKMCKVSASVGISRYPEDGFSYEELFEKADKALYYVKGSGKNNSAVYSQDMARMVACGRRADQIAEEIPDRADPDNYDDFYNEITELTFRLMGDSTDVDSAIQLLLHKLKDYFRFDIVAIQEVVKDEPRTLQCVYEAVSEGVTERLHLCRQYKESEWMLLLYAMEQGRYLQTNGGNEGTDLFFSRGKRISALRIPLGSRNYFTRAVDFIVFEREYKWEERVVRILESFSRILSVYLTKIRTLDEANFLATMMQERDSVTGLYSFDKFLERMKEIVLAKQDNAEIIYVYSDICHFKYINETYGYEVGDLVLRKFAEFLINGKDKNLLCVARVHSDNIVFAMKNIRAYSGERLASIIECQNEQIARILRDYVHDNMIAIRSGLFLAPDSGLSVEEAVSNAAYACKEGKKHNKCCCMVFTENLMIEYKRQLRFLSDLQNAISNKELMIYLQPKVMADGKTVAGAEALVRWMKAGNEMIYPDDFIPVFEKSGAIVEVDYFVYREVFSYLRDRLDRGLPVVPISMNVSRAHIDSQRMPEFVEQLLEEYRIPPSLIEFELTESIYIENFEKAARLIYLLRSKGIKVSMDDFGSGYSSLNMLSEMPIDIIKIDRIFLRKINMRDNDRIILECIINMARKLKLFVVCEGVETKEQYQFLRDIGCDVMQGYYFGKPMPIEEFNRYLGKYNIMLPSI